MYGETLFHWFSFWLSSFAAYSNHFARRDDTAVYSSKIALAQLPKPLCKFKQRSAGHCRSTIKLKQRLPGKLHNSKDLIVIVHARPGRKLPYTNHLIRRLLQTVGLDQRWMISFFKKVNGHCSDFSLRR
jgi:hypothetical protein